MGMKKIGFYVLCLALFAIAQGAGGGMGNGMGGGGPEGGGGHTPGMGKTLSSQQHAHQDLQMMTKKIDLGMAQKDSILKIFQYYYDDLVFYDGKTTPRLLESLAKGRDQKVCKVLDEKQCDQYMRWQQQENRPIGPGMGPPPDDQQHGMPDEDPS